MRAVIVTHNSSHCIARILEDLARAQPIGGEPIRPVVVDETSTDDTLGIARPLVERMGGTVVARSENRGYADGVNTGAATRDDDGKHFLVLNPDQRISPEGPRLLSEALAADRGLAAVGPAYVDEKGAPLPGWYHGPRTSAALLEAAGAFRVLEPIRRVLRRSGRGTGIETIPRGNSLVGAALCIRRSAWENVGTFDEAFFLYHEETDWCLRAGIMGWNLAVRNDVVFTHEGGDSIEKLSPERMEIYLRGRVLLERKHRGEAAAARLEKAFAFARRFR